jgi:hypothetical protein
LLALEIVDEAGGEVDLLAVRFVTLDEGDGSASRTAIDVAAVKTRGRRKRLVNVDLAEREKRGKADAPVPLASLLMLVPIITNELALILPSLNVDVATSAGDFLVRAPVGAVAVLVERGLAVEDSRAARGGIWAREREKWALLTRGRGKEGREEGQNRSEDVGNDDLGRGDGELVI